MIKFTHLFLATVFILISLSYNTAVAQTSATDIQNAENYLRGLNTLKAKFTQTAHNGARLTGTFYLNRPGKLRFEYDDLDDFIVADGLFIYFYDAEMEEQVNAPIGQTLADFILRKNLSLQDNVTVHKIERNDGFVEITIAESSDIAAGSVKLFFQEEPYALKKWQITDAAGLTTEIKLENIQTGIDLPARLFAYFAPKKDKPTYNE